MSQKPTGVFIVLSGGKITVEQATKAREAVIYAAGGLGNYLAAVLTAIGTPVTGAELYPVGYINENAIRGLATGIYQSASLFRDEDKEHYDTVALVRLSDAQAQLAARDAEIVRLRDENERLKRKLAPQFYCSDILEESSMSTREEIVAEAKDYDDDLQAFTTFEMEGYAKTHQSFGFYDNHNKCHWFDTEAEALSAAKALKGGA